MALTYTIEKELGFEAPDFVLLDVVTEKKQSLSELKGEKATVVMFLCNHCPFVIHIREELIQLVNDFSNKGISFIGISSNDYERYPDDSPTKMKRLATVLKFPFPYLFDETQDTARAYDAACTPDFSVFDQDMKCIYRGRFDDSTPGNGISVTGNDLREVLNSLLENKPLTSEQFPSCGCNIKWKLN